MMKAYHKKLEREFVIRAVIDDRVKCEISPLSEPVPSKYCLECRSGFWPEDHGCYSPEFPRAEVELREK
jgi:hypothetical protein